MLERALVGEDQLRHRGHERRRIEPEVRGVESSNPIKNALFQIAIQRLMGFDLPLRAYGFEPEDERARAIDRQRCRTYSRAGEAPRLVSDCRLRSQGPRTVVDDNHSCRE